MFGSLHQMKTRSHQHHRPSAKPTRPNPVIHTSIRSRNATSSSVNSKSVERHDIINTISKNIRRTNDRNKISPQQVTLSKGVVEKQQPHKVSSTSSDKMGIVEDHHHNSNRKKKPKCSPLCIAMSVLVGSIFVITSATLIVIFLIKAKTTQNSLSITANYTLRWNPAGDTVAGIVSQNGTAANQLNLPFDIAVDTYNTLYISDCYNNRIQRWLRSASIGITVCGQANGTSGSTSSNLIYPAGILVDSNSNIYVADGGNSRIQFWPAGATSGTTLAGNGTAGNTAGQLNNAYGIALDSSSDTLYIADYSNHRVMSYAAGASSGTMIAGNGTSGRSATQLSSPTDIYLDSPTNSVVIVNFGTHNIVRWPLGASSWTLVGGSTNGLRNSTSTSLSFPIGMTMDPMGNVYVADMMNHRIQLFLVGRSDGQTIGGVTGVLGSNSTLLYKPYSIALDNQLNLYVTDTYNHRIQRFLRY